MSVLDKVVPGYYHRRMENGDICMSTCCNNMASEHAMCERLIIDDITHWARNYKVGGASTGVVLLEHSFEPRPGGSAVGQQDLIGICKSMALPSGTHGEQGLAPCFLLHHVKCRQAGTSLR